MAISGGNDGCIPNARTTNPYNKIDHITPDAIKIPRAGIFNFCCNDFVADFLVAQKIRNAITITAKATNGKVGVYAGT